MEVANSFKSITAHGKFIIICETTRRLLEYGEGLQRVTQRSIV